MQAPAKRSNTSLYPAASSGRAQDQQAIVNNGRRASSRLQRVLGECEQPLNDPEAVGRQSRAQAASSAPSQGQDMEIDGDAQQEKAVVTRVVAVKGGGVSFAEGAAPLPHTNAPHQAIPFNPAPPDLAFQALSGPQPAHPANNATYSSQTASKLQKPLGAVVVHNGASGSSGAASAGATVAAVINMDAAAATVGAALAVRDMSGTPEAAAEARSLLLRICRLTGTWGVDALMALYVVLEYTISLLRSSEDCIEILKCLGREVDQHVHEVKKR